MLNKPDIAVSITYMYDWIAPIVIGEPPVYGL